jgi:hypothetical protein
VSVKLEDTIYLHFGTASATTGAATNADSTPTVTVEEDGVAMGYAPTVTNVATGLYRVTVAATAANGFETGKRYSVYVAAAVGGVTGRDGIGEFMIYDLATAILDGAYTWEEVLRIIAASMAGKTNGWPAGPVNFRDLADTKNRITGAVDADGNRTAVTLDGT